jgi:cytochrome bd-type quinol oxidase subunit 2
MRWKLINLTSLITALVAFGAWSATAVGFFGSARAFTRHDWLLLGSALIPLLLSVFAGIFVYRHTARRRKTQAILTGLLSLALTVITYAIASQFFPHRLIIPRTYELRHAR